MHWIIGAPEKPLFLMKSIAASCGFIIIIVVLVSNSSARSENPSPHADRDGVATEQGHAPQAVLRRIGKASRMGSVVHHGLFRFAPDVGMPLVRLRAIVCRILSSS
jgi:hypothetical protein